YGPPLRRSATNSEADAEPERKRHTEPNRVNEWNEACSRLGDLKHSDRAGAHPSTATTFASISRGLGVPALFTAGPKPITHAGNRDHCPSTSSDGLAIYIPYARTSS